MAEQPNVASDREKLEQLRKLAASIFDGDAYTRFMTVLQTKPELAQAALQAAMARFQRFGQKMDDAQLVAILKAISSQGRRESRIHIRRK